MQGKYFASHRGSHFQNHKFLYGIRMLFLTNVKISTVMLGSQTQKVAVMIAVISKNSLEANTLKV